MTQAKSNHVPDTIKVQSDNGSLRLQFSTKYNPIFEGKRKHQGLAMKDTPENWQKAVAIAWRIEEDLQHPDWVKLFDPTFAKYGLKTKYTSAALKLAAPIPEAEPEMTVGTMWEEYLIWKQPQLQPTTFRKRYLSLGSNSIKGLVWDNKSKECVESSNGIYDVNLTDVDATKWFNTLQGNFEAKKNILGALEEAFGYLQSLGKTKLTKNPFAFISNKSENKTDMYRTIIASTGEEREWWDKEDNETDPEERDRRAFTKDERDIIIKAFYEHKNASPRQVAALVEFRFLTGCRSGEAFALRWRDVFRGKDKNNIVFSRSYSGEVKATQVTKTGETRVFKMYPKLRDLMLRIKPVDATPNDLVFSKLNGKSWDSSAVGVLWYGVYRSDARPFTPAIVLQLANDDLISGYLPFYNCRHTFISLQAHAGTDLLLLATACGNSVEVIQRHYLGVDTTVKMTDI